MNYEILGICSNSGKNKSSWHIFSSLNFWDLLLARRSLHYSGATHINALSYGCYGSRAQPAMERLVDIDLSAPLRFYERATYSDDDDEEDDADLFFFCGINKAFDVVEPLHTFSL